jgi:hypothetical protein
MTYKKALKEALNANVHGSHTRPGECPAMTDATCNPLQTPTLSVEHERTPDRLAELLACMADLLVDTRNRRADLARRCRDDDPRVLEAIKRLGDLEASFEQVGIEAASVHQELQHLRVI